MFSSTAIEIIKWVKKLAIAKVCGDLSLDLVCGTFKERRSGSDFRVKAVAKAKVSHILRPGSAYVESHMSKVTCSVLRLRYSKQ
jgi:hypothetical protein